MYHYFNVWSSRQSDLEDPLATEFHKRISFAQTDMCRKSNCRHPTLLPGIFTIFCPHGNFF